MKLKLDENGHVVVQDGKPVYVHDDGTDLPFDAPQAIAKIKQLNGEAKTHRETAEKLAKDLNGFEGVDVAEARTAIETVKKLDQKKLLDAGEVDRVVGDVKKQYEEKLTAERESRTKAEQALNNEMIGGNFARSKFIADKLTLPSDIAQATFGKNFKLENGKVVAVGADGSHMLSRANPGEPAGFDEALQILVESYPNRDSILKGNGSQGSGANQGNRGKGGPDLSKLPPVERMNAARGIKAT